MALTYNVFPRVGNFSGGLTKYIFNNVELIFNNFENIFSIMEQHLLKSKTINENKKIKLSYLKNVVKNLVDIEIDKINKILFIK